MIEMQTGMYHESYQQIKVGTSKVFCFQREYIEFLSTLSTIGGGAGDRFFCGF
jgi:hypothetical protein